jgi:hypothetical protein
MRKRSLLLGIVVAMVISTASAHAKRAEWRRLNQNPFIRYPILSEEQLARDRKGLKLFGLTDEQIDRVLSLHQRAMAEKLKEGEGFRWDHIKEDDEFDMALFGDFQLWGEGLVVRLGHFRVAARVYTLSDGTEIWYPLYCGNWSVKFAKPVKKVAMQPPPLAETEQVETYTPAPLSPPEPPRSTVCDWDCSASWQCVCS